jgi:hypothetical protein
LRHKFRAVFPLYNKIEGDFDMKKVLLISTVLFLMASGIAFAGATRENCGCGLGTMLFDGADGLVQQVLAVTTNGTSGTQTFGISSGTLDCNLPSRYVSNENLNRFIADNMDNLAKDVAMGQGEYVDALAEIMDVPGSERVEFSQMLQENFSNIFTDGSISHMDVVENIAHLM